MDAMEVSQGHVARFASQVWEPDDLIELRAIRPGPSIVQDWVKAVELTRKGGAWAWIERHIAEQYNVYAGINPRFRVGGKSSDVKLARCLFADFDNSTMDSARRAVSEANLPEPSLWVNSGHGVHVYWVLGEPINDLSVWTRYQKALIAVLGSDPVIHDAPRIMRVPGTVNFKQDPARDCVIVAGEGGRVAIREMGLEPVGDSGIAGLIEAAAAGIGGMGGGRENLTAATARFLAFGAGEGERNARLFNAACDYAGNGLDFADAVRDLMPAALRAGLPEWEAQGAIKSAYSKARTPAKPVLPDGPLIAPLEPGGPAAGIVGPVAGTGDGEGSGAGGPPAPVMAGAGGLVGGASSGAAAGAGRTIEPKPLVSNVVDSYIMGEDGERKPIQYYKPISQLGDEIKALTGGWPKIAGGILFVASSFQDGEIPTGKSIRTFARAPELFSWLQEVAEFRWSEKVCVKPGDKSPRTPATKDEVLSHLKERTADRFLGVSVLPHHPPMPGVFYMPVKLPASDGTALDELLEMLNPDSEVDRQLMLAALLTPGWGGPAGGRPAFIFTSTHGRGVGKTSTAEFFAEIWGGKISIGAKEPFDQVIKRLLGDDGLGKRVALIDNVKGKMSGAEIEGMITAKTIDGWRPYYGNYSRPNYMTVYLSANAPQFSQDLSQRSVLIQVGKHRHGESFIARAERFVAERRPAILADLYALLANEPTGQVSKANRDRFQAWQDGVLCRLQDPDRLARMIIDRRGGVDVDAEDAEDVAEAIRKYIKAKGLNPDRDTVRIGRDEMRDLLIAAKVFDDGFGKRGVMTVLGGMLGDSGPLAQLKDNPGKHEGPRKWVWNYRPEDPNTGGFDTDDTQIPI